MSEKCEKCGGILPTPVYKWKPLDQLQFPAISTPNLDRLREEERKAHCTCPPAPLSYVDETAPFKQEDWDKIVERMNRRTAILHNGPKLTVVPKHDGKLDKDGYADVKIDEYPHICITSRGDEEARYIETACLTPMQALTLRDWLIQESPELERLVKEQEG